MAIPDYITQTARRLLRTWLPGYLVVVFLKKVVIGWSATPAAARHRTALYRANHACSCEFVCCLLSLIVISKRLACRGTVAWVLYAASTVQCR